MSTVTQSARPLFSTPALWAVRILSWLAFAITAYLAWTAITQTPAAGCSVGSNTGCDAVLGSSWSKWLGVPVAVFGLACYASLASLSVVLRSQDARLIRWVPTAFVTLATVAMCASLWFLALQAIAIGEFCMYCVPADIFGIAIGAISLWSAWRARSAGMYVSMPRTAAASAGMAALRSALPAGARTGTVPVMVRPSAPRRAIAISPPSLPIALGVTAAAMAVLVGGQIVFRGKTHEVQQVALEKPIDMSGADSANDESASGDAETHVTKRIPAEESGNVEEAANSNGASEGDGDASGDSSTSQPSEASPGDASQKSAAVLASAKSNSATDAADDVPLTPERKVKLLNGKLILDLYKQPLIGSPKAPHIVAEIISYDCPHCRKAHRQMKQALARYGDQVALLVLVMPMEKNCNRLITDPAASHPGACTTARMALGVSKVKPASFGRYHDFLMSGDKDKPPALDSIIAKAYNTADRNRLRDLRSSDVLDKDIAATINLYDSLSKQHKGNKKFGLPIQIVGDYVMTGTIEKTDDIYKAWEEHLGVKPR